MRNRLLTVGCLLVLLSTVSAGMAEDHDFSFPRPSTEEKPSRSEFVSAIKKLVTAGTDRGKLSLTAYDGEGTEAARVNLTAMLSNFSSWEEIVDYVEGPAPFKVWDFEKARRGKGEFTDSEIPDLTTALFVALSRKNGNGDARSVFGKNREDRWAAVDLTTSRADLLSNIEQKVKSFLASGASLGFLPATRGSSQRPIDNIFAFDPQRKTHTRQNFEREADAWDVNQATQAVGNDPEFWGQVRQATDGSPHAIPTPEKLRKILSSQEITGLIDDTGVRESLRPRVQSALEAKVLFRNFNIEDLKKLVRVEKSWNGTMTASPIRGKEADALRRRLLQSPDAKHFLSMIRHTLDEKVRFTIFETNTRRMVEGEIPSLGSLVAMALSTPERKRGQGLRLVLEDSDGYVHEVTAASKFADPLLQIKGVLAKVFERIDDSEMDMADATSLGERPPDVVHMVRSDRGGVETKSNKAETDEYDGNQMAQWVIQSPDFKKAAFGAFMEGRKRHVPDIGAEALTQPTLHTTLVNATDDPGIRAALENGIKTRVGDLANEFRDPTDQRLVQVGATQVTPNTNVVPNRSDGVPMLGLIHSSVAGGWYRDRYGRNYQAGGMTSSATAVGAEAHTINNINDAKSWVLHKYNETGQKMDLILGSHGCGGFMMQMTNDERAFQAFLRETSGMLRHVYLMGCSVGAGADRHLNHIQRRLVAWGADSVSAVDQTLYFGGGMFYLQSWGRLMKAYPTYNNHPLAK